MSDEPQRILVVDDEPQLLRALRINLRARGYAVSVAATGASALSQVASVRPDLVILDLGLPDLDGLGVLDGIRGWNSVPVIVLSARGDAADKVAALNSGADDYVTKPFGMEELVARIRAAIRRSTATPATSDPVIEGAGFQIDLSAKTVTRDGQPIRLTPTEWGVLEILARNEGKLVSQRELLEKVWGPTYLNNTNYLRIYIASLRRKLETDPSAPRHLITEAGMGYRFVR